MNFRIHFKDEKIGLISAYRNNQKTRIIDLKFTFNKDSVIINVFSGLLSNDYQNISFDENTAFTFSEILFNSLKEEVKLNSFSLEKEDYLSVL